MLVYLFLFYNYTFMNMGTDFLNMGTDFLFNAKKERVKIVKFLLFLGANEVVIYNFFHTFND